MWTHRAALPLALLLAACQAYGRPDVALRRDFTGVEINRIRDHHRFYSDYEDIALLDAIHRVLRAGCDSLVYMKANAHGRVFSVHDKGGCLKPGAPSKSEVY